MLPKIVEMTTIENKINNFEYDSSPVSFNLYMNNKPVTDFSEL